MIFIRQFFDNFSNKNGFKYYFRSDKKEEEKNRGGSGGRGKRERERKRRSFVSWVIQFRNIDKVVVDMRVIRGAEGVEKKKWKKKEMG